MAALFFGLALMEFNLQNTQQGKSNVAVEMNLKLLTQVKEFRAQRNFYICAIGSVLSLLVVGISTLQQKVLDLEHKVESSKTK